MSPQLKRVGGGGNGLGSKEPQPKGEEGRGGEGLERAPISRGWESEEVDGARESPNRGTEHQPRRQVICTKQVKVSFATVSLSREAVRRQSALQLPFAAAFAASTESRESAS